MAIDPWLGFFGRHVERFPRGDWPPSQSGFWADFRRKLVKHGVRPEEAEAASVSLFDDGPRPEFVSDHPDAIQAKARELLSATRRPADAPSKPRSQIEEEACNDEWNRKAQSHWDSLEENDREDWRKFVHERAPFARGSRRTIELLALAWAFDPSSVLPEPPREEPKPIRQGPRRIFEPIPFKE